MNRPLVLACLGALAGFAFWIWLTGPGTSVPNALIALVIAIAAGRLVWWLAERREELAEEAPAEPLPPGRVPPPPDAAPWRRPDGTP